eukprot:CAMPEP_0119138630 /NCGR_PEP_ID=MMETSP1310-20130426/26019_1 /TAXON_ID=464262 /ORGANISM="Genus nov. species nov., Strain RCC2339" /LENGTH=70 /DNA_ID=CAMNT_0007129839 /DNA_START=65 /DNA_END=274 /DNA_ORIENTATION=-
MIALLSRVKEGRSRPLASAMYACRVSTDHGLNPVSVPGGVPSSCEGSDCDNSAARPGVPGVAATEPEPKS